MKDSYPDKIIKLIPAIITVLFFFTFFKQLILSFETILTPTVLTAITIIILLPFRKEYKVVNTLIIITGFLYGIWFLSLIKSIVIPFTIAIILAYISDPVVLYLEKKGISRAKGAMLLIGVIVLLFIIMLLFIIPALVSNISDFVIQIPSMKNNLIEWFNKLQKIEFFRKLGEYKIPPYLEEAIDKLLADIQNSSRELSNKSVSFITESFSSVMHFLLGLLELLIIPVFVFYMLEEKNEIRKFCVSFIPMEKREAIFSMTDDINNTLSTFLRGQLFNCTVIGTLTGIALFLTGIKFSLLIGVFTAVMTFIPYAGNIIGPSPGLILALFTSNPLVSIIAVLIIIVAMHLLDSYYLYPTVHGKTLNLSPLMIMMAVIIGGQLYGAAGMFLAIPLICVLKVLLRGWIKRHTVSNEPVPEKDEISGDKSQIENKMSEKKEVKSACEIEKKISEKEKCEDSCERENKIFENKESKSISEIENEISEKKKEGTGENHRENRSNTAGEENHKQ